MFAFLPPLVSQSAGLLPDGRPNPGLAPSGASLVVLFFVASDCPLSDRMFPVMHRLRTSMLQRGIQFWYVYPNAGELTSVVRLHQQEFDASGDFLLDPSNNLAHLARATVTPQAALLSRASAGRAVKWNPLYTGRIDNRFASIGHERPQPTRNDLAEAINLALAGKPIPNISTSAVGCSIVGPH